MVRNASSAMGRGLALALLIGLGVLTPLEALSQEDPATGSSQASPAEGEESKPEVREPEPEYEEIQTPFGVIRRPRSQTRSSAPRAAPEPVETQAAPPASDEAAAPAPETTSDPSAPEAQQSPGATGPNSRFRFNCVDCDLLEFVRNIANELKLNYVVEPNVQGVVNILTYGEMRRGDLMTLLETVLEINGAAMVKTGPVYRILPGPNAKQLPLGIRRDPTAAAAPSENSRVLQILPVNFVPAADMAELLTPFLSQGADVTYHQAANFLIVTDTPANIGKLLELVGIFDSAVFGGKRVRVYALENTRATNLALELEIIFAGYAGTEESPIRFLPIPRLNSLLVISPNTGGFEEVDRWIARLDQAGQNREIRNYFVKIQNGDATSIAEVLLKIYGAGTREKEQDFLPSNGGSPTEMLQAAEPEDRTEEIVQGEIKIVADEQNNALIVQCSPQDFEIIEETIRELDRVPRQVLIKVKIYEVVLDNELSMGISAFLQDRNKPAVSSPSVTTAGYGTAAGGSGALNLATRALMGDTRELVAFLNAEETRNRSRVLSAPSVIASDNIAASIQVGSQIPILTSQGVVPGGTGSTSLFSNTISSRNTGVILNVTPRINAGGWVTLAVEQEVSSPGPPPTAGIQSPSINMRSVATQVTIKNGQTIAIGGIISDTNGVSRNGLPILSRIPGLGLLFGNTTRKKNRTELIALITPHVIEDIEQAADLTEELKSTLKGLKKELSRDEG
ncbi:MAG: type II secretion system secretin GspD [Acidobacteriota bacterium]|nr:type II secretion system secretin GspD [Acidobacteriota bacterium]MDE2963933.1 type II secretion system secretin GspD [Acidobacteriota bacterium]